MMMNYSINTTWDSQAIDHLPVTISMEPDRCYNLVVTVDAPFFNDPANPGGKPGQPFPQLWDYEGSFNCHEWFFFHSCFLNTFKTIKFNFK
jgi:hypothetical protein